MSKLIKVVSAPIFYFERFSRFLLYYIFRFDKWHLSTLKERKYATDIVHYCNTLKRDKLVIEIGCGLGDIVRNIDSTRSLGFDREVNALKAARFLTILKFREIRFRLHEFPNDEIKGQFDVIILVNWIHHIEPFLLKSEIQKIFRLNLNINGIIILDTVQDKEYQYNHNIDYLTNGISCELEKLGSYSRLREVWIIKKLNQ
jgi:SAM-dependent methyltransferase